MAIIDEHRLSCAEAAIRITHGDRAVDMLPEVLALHPEVKNNQLIGGRDQLVRLARR
jgi:hypothetical protein